MRRTLGCGSGSGGGQVKLLRRHFFDKVGRDWEKAWTQQVTPWELQGVNPSFVEGLALLPPSTNDPQVGGRRKALVPGCGSGFDLLHLHAQGWDATGLDISSTAIDVARSNLGRDANSITLVQADFFAPSTPSVQPHSFDLIYDYLFFAAIDPSMRAACAARFHALLRPDTGRLVTLLFPLAPPPLPLSYSSISSSTSTDQGPPYVLSLDDYRHILEPAGLVLDSTHVPKTSIPPRRGRELLAVWSRS
ncbi:hypothetical protein DYB34_008831 [Aphanomyces astaci]|uniref:Methyltransferase domain-containing protein n=1 Tax=Aphanomyces astaci TaxID=112090 RepID=A0A418C8J2_APHAT|nr:hypothetical protein DYB34_008831 [Aphanomyces astaci]